MPRFKLRHLFAFSLLVSALCPHPAQAMGVDFAIAPSLSLVTTDNSSLEKQPIASSPVTSDALVNPVQQPLPIPPKASTPPTRSPQEHRPLPSNVLASARILTPPPPEALPTARVFTPTHPQTARAHDAIGLDFKTATKADDSTQTKNMGSHQPTLPQWIYEGGSNSLVARVIGSAEGTRTPSGQPTRAYYGHTDPGNGVWNMGTFSYQHGAASPDEADDKQLKRLQRQGENIEQQAKKADLSMSLGEVLNGLDLANQAPLAALDRGGYVDRLVQARHKGMNNDDAIIWARTYAYLDPDSQRWNAPGLGNTLTSIRRDQNRRHQAITQAFEHYMAQRDATDHPPTDSLDTPALALASPPSMTSLQSSEPQQDNQDIGNLLSPSIEPVEFSMADGPDHDTPAADSSQAMAVPMAETGQIRS